MTDRDQEIARLAARIRALEAERSAERLAALSSINDKAALK